MTEFKYICPPGMLFKFIYTHFITWTAIIVWRLGMKKTFPRLYICGKCLLNQPIDRLPQNYNKGILGPIRLFRVSLNIIFAKRATYVKSSDDPVCIYNGSLDSFKERQKYLKKMCGDTAGMCISKNASASNLPGPWKIISAIYLFFSALFVTPLVVFSSRRSNWSILPLQIVELSHVILMVRKNKIRKIHNFCIYLSDSNLAAFLFMKYGLTVNKIASEAPIGFLNREIIGDTLALCFRYQEDESREYRETIHVKEYFHWAPELALEHANKIFSRPVPDSPKDIGYYSSAIWLRSREGHADFKDNSNEAEKQLINNLVDFMEKHKELSLVIFLHPLEKATPEILKESKELYQKKFEGINLTFSLPDQSSAEFFADASLGVGVYSAILFERLFFGHKTLLFPLGMDWFPIESSAFRNVCAKSREELFVMMEKNLPLGAKDFFEQNKLEKYTFESYPEFTS